MAVADAAQSPGAEQVSAAQQRKKLLGREFYKSIGSPKYIVAPMVDRSEFVGSLFLRAKRQTTNVLSVVGMAHAHSILHATR